MCHFIFVPIKLLIYVFVLFHLQTTNEPMTVDQNDMFVSNDSMKAANVTNANHSSTFHVMSDIEKKSVSVKKLLSLLNNYIVHNFLLLVIILLGMMYV